MTDQPPRAFGYFQYCPFSTSKAMAAQQEETINDYFRRVLEPRGVCFAGHVWEPVNERKTPLRLMPEGRKLLMALSADDHLLVPSVDAAFADFTDFWRLVRQFSLSARSLHVIAANLDTGNAAQLARLQADAAVIERWSNFNRSQAVTRKQIGNAKRRLDGRHIAGSVPLGFRIGSDRRLVPDEDKREIMRFIVEQHDTNNRGFGEISTHLTKERIMREVRDKRERRGYRLEFWDRYTVERSYLAMKAIEAAEAAGKPFQPRPPSDGRRRPALSAR